jgi:hypothetical protein
MLNIFCFCGLCYIRANIDIDIHRLRHLPLPTPNANYAFDLKISDEDNIHTFKPSRLPAEPLR